MSVTEQQSPSFYWRFTAITIKQNNSKLSVVIVTYNRGNDLKESLKAILELNIPPLEIIVVDSNSTDSTPQIVRNYPVRFINIKQKSMVVARNVGWRQSKGDIVAFIDDDAIVSKTWSKYILEPFRDKKVGGVVGRVIPSKDEEEIVIPEKHNKIGKVFSNGLVIGNFDLDKESNIEVDTLIGCNMAFRKGVIIKVGGFDENFKGNCFRDDTDISLRIRKHGYKLIFHPKALVIHKYKGKLVSNNWFYWTVYNHTYFYMKNFKPVNLSKFFTFLIATFHPPADYMKKTKIQIKPDFKSICYIFLGLFDAIFANKVNSDN